MSVGKTLKISSVPAPSIRIIREADLQAPVKRVERAGPQAEVQQYSNTGYLAVLAANYRAWKTHQQFLAQAPRSSTKENPGPAKELPSERSVSTYQARVSPQVNPKAWQLAQLVSGRKRVQAEGASQSDEKSAPRTFPPIIRA